MELLLILGGYTIVLVFIFIITHYRAVEGHSKVAKHWEIKYQKLLHEHEVLQDRLDDRNNTVEFLKERLAEMETVQREVCPGTVEE